MTKKHINRRHFLAAGMASGIAGMTTTWLVKPGFADELNIETALSPRVIGDPDAPY